MLASGQDWRRYPAMASDGGWVRRSRRRWSDLSTEIFFMDLQKIVVNGIDRWYYVCYSG